MGAFKQLLIGFDLAQSGALKSFNDGVRYARIEEREPLKTIKAQWFSPLRVKMGWCEDVGIDDGITRYFDSWKQAVEACEQWMGGEL